MWPLIVLIGKYATKLGIEVIIEAGAKTVVNKFSKKVGPTDRLNTQCAIDGCGGFRVEDPDDTELVYCGNCKTVSARYKVTK